LPRAPPTRGEARWCPLLHKGPREEGANPTLLLHTRSRKLKFVSATDSGLSDGAEYVLSNARLTTQVSFFFLSSYD